jgi:Bacterial PH domain
MMSGSWQRVGPWTLRTVSGAVFAVLGAGLAVLLGYAVVALGWPGTLGLVGWAVLGLWIAYWWRTLLSGVFLGEDSIRVRGVAVTRTFPAADVIEVRSRSRRIATDGAPLKVREVCLDLYTGRTVSTPILGDKPEGGGIFRHNVLSAPIYDMIVDRLREHVANAEPPLDEEDPPEPPQIPEPRRKPSRGAERTPPPGIIEWTRRGWPS